MLGFDNMKSDLQLALELADICDAITGPIDATKNYIRGIPIFATLIASTARSEWCQRKPAAASRISRASRGLTAAARFLPTVIFTIGFWRA